MLIFVCTSILERYFLVIKHVNATRDHYISTSFLAVVVFVLALQPLYSVDNIKLVEKCQYIVAIVGRKYSNWIYVMHPIFSIVLIRFTKEFDIYGLYQYVAPVIVYIATTVFVFFLYGSKEI